LWAAAKYFRRRHGQSCNNTNMMSSSSSEADDENVPLLKQKQRADHGSTSTPPGGGSEEKKGEIVSNYDQILAYIGDMGLWQFSAIAILWPPSMAGGIIVLLSSFTALEPRAFRCALEVKFTISR
jgi:hypothetical protein